PGSAQLMAHLIDAAPSAARAHLLAWRDDLLWLFYPDWFKATGWEPTQAAEALSAEGALEPDPRTPMRRVREYDGERWLVLTAEVSERLRLLVEEARSSQTAVEPHSAASDQPLALSPETSAPTSTSTPRPTAASRLPSSQTSPNRPATASGQGTTEQHSSEPTNPEEPTDKPPLIPAILADLEREHGPGDGSQVLVLDSTMLKALAKRHGLGVYSLRQRLLTDPRFRLGAHQRIEVQR
ncbi:MAG: hypothetical protein VBE63_30355, partial [Lamprobacter sp.]|nr:hypothetical protein [Lamprobacter sp.]